MLTRLRLVIVGPLLKITGSPTPGDSIVTVEYDVTFNKFDVAADQPYSESVKLIGDDTGPGDGAGAGADDALTTLVPSIIFLPSIIRATDIVAPAAALHRTVTRTISNTVLDEDSRRSRTRTRSGPSSP